MIDDWRQALDGELICFILESGGTINFNDMPSLAGALYNSRQDDFQDRAMLTISYLLKAGKITSSPSDSTRICLLAAESSI